MCWMIQSIIYGVKGELDESEELQFGEEWRLEYLSKLLEQRPIAHYSANKEEEGESPS